MAGDFAIRTAGVADYEAVCELYRQADALHAKHVPGTFVRPGKYPRSREWFEAAVNLADDAGIWLVGELDGEIVAFVRVATRSVDAPYLVARRYPVVEEIVVRAARRRRGLGRRLMERAHEWARAHGFHEMELTVWEFNAGAITLYEELGYSTVMRRMRTKL